MERIVVDLISGEQTTVALTEEEIAELEANAVPEPAIPDYRGFYDSLLVSAAYQSIRTQAITSLPLTLAAVEFIAAMGDAKAGIPNEAALQACIDNIAAAATDLTEDDWIEIGELLVTYNLTTIYTLPSQP
jgi:hypothetical protein